jgi:hypothetical protein
MKCRPFVTETGRDVRINVSRDVVHRGRDNPACAQIPCLFEEEGLGQVARPGADSGLFVKVLTGRP